MSTLLYNDDEDVANKFDEDTTMSDDDEPMNVPKRQLRGKLKVFAVFNDSLVRVNPIKKKEAPLEETSFNVLFELTGVGSKMDRHGVDIVTVLDVSYSMKGKKLEHLKTAMLLLISQLTSIDRLSVVTFSNNSERLFPLRKITKDSSKEIGDLVTTKLVPLSATNIAAGLETALKVIKERKITKGREVAIMLMSDGDQNINDAAKVVVGDVPVYTFGFSAGMDAEYNPKLLNDIARKSNGGTFSLADTEDTVASNLSMVFSQCLARLVTIVVRDLMLKVRSLKSKITRVIAGSYPQTNDNADGSVTIALGNLSIDEMRNVMVDLVLRPVAKEGAVDILEFSFSYNSNAGPFDSGPRIIRVNRVATTEEQEPMKVMVEQTRLKTKSIITQAREMADKNQHEDAKHMLNEAYGSLEDVFDDEADLKFEMLRRELNQLSTFMSPQMYNTHGRSFALSSETSHDQQRFAARGDVAQLRMFATPHMDACLVEAKSFHIKHHS